MSKLKSYAVEINVAGHYPLYLNIAARSEAEAEEQVSLLLEEAELKAYCKDGRDVRY